MQPIEEMTIGEIEKAIQHLSLGLIEGSLTPAQDSYLQSLKETHEFGLETAQAMARNRALARRAEMKIVRTPEQIAQRQAQQQESARMAKLALDPTVQNLKAERDEANGQKNVAARLDQVEIDSLNIEVGRLKASNEHLEGEVERLARINTEMSIEMGRLYTARNRPTSFLSKLKDLFRV